MPAAKKYKLFSATASTEGGSVPLCAFFATEQGCKNGESCKFRHALPGAEATSPGNVVPASSSSVVSSESEVGNVEGAATKVFVRPNEVVMKKQPEEKKKKKRKNKKRKNDGLTEHDNIFANPKKHIPATTVAPHPDKKKQKTSQERRPHGAATPSPTPGSFAATGNTPEELQKLQHAPPAQRSASRERPKKAKTLQQSTTPDFRSLNLPVASCSKLAVNKEEKKKTPTRSDSRTEDDTSDVSVPPRPFFPVPKSTPVGLKWHKLVLETRSHEQYDGSFTFQRYKELDQNAGRGNPSEWIKARPFGDWCRNNPQAIAIDCEMCETKDPVSGVTDPKALCRISVVDAENPDDVLLDTLVKPAWPVVDYRSWVNGIKEEHLENVQFTLRHAQAFLMALCSEETVILGHALHNDLVALKMEHQCVVDSALLFPVKDSPDSSPSLKDLSKTLLQKDMPALHDSVNDARTALHCLQVYLACDGKVEPIVRTPRANRSNASQLFVHRIPKICKPSHLSAMFLSHASIQPSEVGEIEFSGTSGKTLVSFPSSRHANLAFDTLEGTEEPDKSGRMQKKVFLRNGDYVRVRKMTYIQNRNGTPRK